MDADRFLQACRSMMGGERNRQGIGRLGEKTLHAVLKTYFDPDPDRQEVPAGPFVADIRNEAGFLEIQTRDLYRLREKVEHFLTQAPVKVVFPIPAVKWLIWIDEDGCLSPRRKSPKRGTACQLLPELFAFRDLLDREDLLFCAVLLELEEYRLKNGWSADGKKGSSRFDRLPIALLDEVWVTRPEDLVFLLPDALPENFKAKDLSKLAGLSSRKTSSALKVLLSAEVIEQAGRDGRAFLYRRKAS